MPGIIRSMIERRVHPSNPNKWLVEALGGAETKSGIQIDEPSSMKFAAVHACVRVIAEAVASLPLPVYRRLDPRGKERIPGDPLYRLLHDQPNPEITSFRFRETMMAHVLLWGNAYAEIEYDRSMRPIALWPLLPDRTWVERKDKVLRYKTRVNGQEFVLQAGQVLHIPGLSFDGIRGFSPISLHKEAIALGLAAEQTGALMYGRGANAAGIIQIDKKFARPEDRDDFARQFERAYTGLENAQRQIILEQGMKWQQTQMPATDAQYIQSRTFQIREIARIFRVPPHMIAELEQATFSNIEHQSIDFVVHTLRPWLVRWEQSIQTRLIPTARRSSIFAEFLVDGLLRGDLEARYKAYSVARNGGWMSANDIREAENMNPIEGGEIYLIPLNMVPAADVANGTGAADDRSDDVPPASAAALEERTRRSVTGRRRSQKVHRGLMTSAVGRVLHREVDAIRKQVRNGADLPSWMEQFYLADGDQAKYARRQVLPVLQAMGEMVAADAADEIGADDVGDQLDGEVRAYADGMVNRMHESSRGQLQQIVTQVSPGEVDGAIETRLTQWEETRAAKIAKRNTVDAGSMIAKAVWTLNGISQLVWRTVGESCPLCLQLDGKAVEITKHFVQAGDRVDPGGGTTPLDVTRNLGHPPLHEGCDCTISPG